MTRFVLLLLLSAIGFARTDWPSYGNDPGAMRYSPLGEIRKDNVACNPLFFLPAPADRKRAVGRADVVQEGG